MQNLCDKLKSNPYPGRGIVLGCDAAGSGLVVYFIMGRSENSRNRVFSETGDGIVTEAADPAKLRDPSLIIYAPVRREGRNLIVTNGDQTDTIYDALRAGQSFESALRSRTFEPDAPNYTPRISGIMDTETLAYRLAILKSANGNPDFAQRFFFEYTPQPGCGHFIHTYQSDGDLLPSFLGEPVAVALPKDAEQWGNEIWQSLHFENKVSLFVRSLRADGTEQTWIYNRFSKV